MTQEAHAAAAWEQYHLDLCQYYESQGLAPDEAEARATAEVKREIRIRTRFQLFRIVRSFMFERWNVYGFVPGRGEQWFATFRDAEDAQAYVKTKMDSE